MVSKPAVIGIDLGADTSYVAYVGKSVVDIVQNEVSKRDNPSLVCFTNRERLLGDAALAQIKSNAKNSCRNFKHLLGQKVDAPTLEKEIFWSTSELLNVNGRAGYAVTYKGDTAEFSAEQITAMFLTKLREVTEKWCQAKVTDVVIGVPSYYSDVHREALLDAARIANISVLRLMNEYTATALAYGIYRSNDFDPEKPCTVAFCSVGHTMFSVCVVQFVRGKLTTLAEASDKVGGRDMDECLMREFAAQFQKKNGCDPLSDKKARFKLEDAVGKTKKVLSSNNEAPCNVECLMEDIDFFSVITREDFERMCQPMMDKVLSVLRRAKAMASIPIESIDFVEMVGGSSRVPWIKRICSQEFGCKELSFTMNADEAVSRGCALMAAILSPHYKVRDFTVQDTSPYEITLGWLCSASDLEAKEAGDGDTMMVGKDGEYKSVTIFPAGSAMNTLKILTFWRKGPFEIKAQYASGTHLLPGTPLELGTYTIKLPVFPESKKVKVRVKLTIHGTFIVEGAQMVEEEEYEEFSKEKRESPIECTNEEAAPPSVEEGGDSAGASPKATSEKKCEWVEVKRTKKRLKRTDVVVSVDGRPGLSQGQVRQLMDYETRMQVEMREIIATDEKRNDLESYIFNTRDKISSSGVWGQYISDSDREKFTTALSNAENWLYDTDGATRVMYIEKLDELKTMGDAVDWRCNEDNGRPAWIAALQGTIANYLAAAERPGEKYRHIAPHKLTSIVQKCHELRAWLEEKLTEQEVLLKTEKPVLLSVDMEKRQNELVKFADEIFKEPNMAPAKEVKMEKDKVDDAKGEGTPETPEMAKTAEAAPINMDVD